MKKVNECYKLKSSLVTGQVYSWEGLKKQKKSPGRDIKRLLDQDLLVKVGPGLYLPPKTSRFGQMPVDDNSLVKKFLKSNDFLLFSTNLYNSLELGLTQLKNEMVVYNKKRYENIELSGRIFSFKRPNNGFPNKLTPEFLLVDLVNNLKFIGESPSNIKKKITQNVRLGKYDNGLLLKLTNNYGKIGTKKFFNEILGSRDK